MPAVRGSRKQRLRNDFSEDGVAFGPIRYKGSWSAR